MSAALQNVRTGGTKRGTELVRFDALRPRRRPSDRASGPSRIGYVPALDGMRGVAVLLVMAFHARAPFLPGGFMGVDVFFVLSGFLITCLLLAEREQKGHIDLKNFYMRRALRLLPAVVAFLGVYVLSVLILCREVRDHLLDALIVLFYAANWTRALGLGRPDRLGHAWSLSIEEQFYLVWPLLLIVLWRLWPSRRALGAILLGTAVGVALYRAFLYHGGTSPERLYNGLDTRADALLIGCALAFVPFPKKRRGSQPPTWETRVRWAVGVLALGSLACLGFLANRATWKHPLMLYVLQFAIPVFAAVVLAHVLLSERGVLRWLLEGRLVVWLGRRSYGMYLWHYPVFRILQLDLRWSPYVVLAAGSAIAIVAAAASYAFVEQPFLRLKSKYQ